MKIDTDKKIVLIGLDGVPYNMIEEFSQDGTMLNMAKLITDGVFRKSESTIPEISSVAWSSTITGKNPGEHGIFGFTDLHKNSYQLKFPNFNDLKEEPFWQQWDCESVIINVPSTYPSHDINGVHISGFVSIDINKSVSPASLIPTLMDMDYRLDVDSSKAHESMDLFLEDLDKTLSARIDCYRHLWAQGNWQFFMLVFTGTDRLMHFLYEAYEDKSHRYHDKFLEHFRKIDSIIGEISERISDKDTLLLMSDHGFEKLDYDVYLNRFLIDENLLSFTAGADPSLENISNDTIAFVMDPGRVYINYSDKYPCGCVDRRDEKIIISKLKTLFGGLSINSKKVIRDIYTKDEIFFGNYTKDAPDITLVANEGFNLKAMMKTPGLYSKGIFTGKHTQDTAFLLAKGISSDIIGENPKVSDVRRILESTMK